MDRSASATAGDLQLARAGRADLLGGLLEHPRNYLKILATTCLHSDLRGKADASDAEQVLLWLP